MSGEACNLMGAATSLGWPPWPRTLPPALDLTPLPRKWGGGAGILLRSKTDLLNFSHSFACS